MSLTAFETDVRKLLVGPFAGDAAAYEDRVYADFLPQNATYPAAVFELDYAEMDQDWGGDNGFREETVTVSIYSMDLDDRSACVAFLRNHLSGFEGTEFETGEGTVTLSTRILRIVVSRGATFFDEVTRCYVQEVDLEITMQD